MSFFKYYWLDNVMRRSEFTVKLTFFDIRRQAAEN